MFPTKTGDFSWDLAKEIMIWWKSSGNDHGIVIYSNPESAKRCPKVHQDGKKHLSTLLLSINPSHTETKPTEHTLSGFFITIQFFFKPWTKQICHHPPSSWNWWDLHVRPCAEPCCPGCTSIRDRPRSRSGSWAPWGSTQRNSPSETLKT